VNERGGSLTVRDLLGARIVPEGQVLAGARGLDAEVLDVRLAADVGAVEECQPGDLVILTGHAPYLVEVALRRASAADVRAITLVRPGSGPCQPPSAATLSFANRLGVPLLQTESTDPLLIADALRTAVRRPDLAEARLLNAVLTGLRGQPPDPERVLPTLDEQLGVTAALVSADGTAIAGSVPAGIAESTLAGSATAQTVEVTGNKAVIVPVESDRTGHVRLWLVAHVPSGGQRWAETVLHVSQAASWALGTWLAAERLDAERSAHSRSSLLAELLACGDAVPARIVQQAVMAGWRLDGWHLGVYVVSHCSADEPGGEVGLVPTVTERLRKSFERQGLHGPLVEGAEGWSFWITKDTEPSLAASRDLTRRIQHALAAPLDSHPMVGGIGRPYAGASGVGRTLGEAREAAGMAGLSAGQARAVHIDELGMLRLLSIASGTPEFAEQATRLLEPLATADDGQLLRTLAVYLDLESSASSTAARLGVHRNTVAQRISRAEQLLGVNLVHPDERLAIQLACRVVRAAE
jgi:PucR family transcriptional regulator, purine catabolism regulatory protein